jgi:hypothetical protein
MNGTPPPGTGRLSASKLGRNDLSMTNDLDTTVKANVDEPSASPRRPYRKPELRRLGSVRELTLGSPVAGALDGKGLRRPLM